MEIVLPSFTNTSELDENFENYCRAKFTQNLVKFINILGYVIISQTLPLTIKRNLLENPIPLGEYVICEGPLIFLSI